MTRRRATALGVAAIVLWGSTVAFGRSLTAQLGPIRAAGAVYALCAAISLGLLLVRPARLREALRLPRRYLLVCGALFVLYVVCFYLALGLSAGAQQAIEVGTVNYLWPAATVVLSVPILGVRARWTLWPGVLLALAGIAGATLSGRGWTLAASWESLRRDWLPYLLALAGALVWALYSNLSRRWAGGAGAGAVPLFMVATALVMVPLALAHPGAAPQWTLRTVAELVYLGVFPTTLGYAFWEVAMRRGNILRVATLSYFTPLLAAAIAAAYLGAVPGPGLWLGCALVVAGAWVCQRSVGGPATPEGPRS
ncbi:MAG: aromatic amino acid DMT transporter YddG [Thermoanaerobaculaceae bacterium]